MLGIGDILFCFFGGLILSAIPAIIMISVITTRDFGSVAAEIRS